MPQQKQGAPRPPRRGPLPQQPSMPPTKTAQCAESIAKISSATPSTATMELTLSGSKHTSRRALKKALVGRPGVCTRGAGGDHENAIWPCFLPISVSRLRLSLSGRLSDLFGRNGGERGAEGQTTGAGVMPSLTGRQPRLRRRRELEAPEHAHVTFELELRSPFGMPCPIIPSAPGALKRPQSAALNAERARRLCRRRRP
jgi:hypothetical protein